MADHFQNQIRFWGIAPSYAFVGEPETNGVIERLFRTLKEQIIHGRVFQTIDEVREAVRDFLARYNAAWLIEKNGYLSPLDAPAARLDTNLRRAA
jgi:transposase InsO family protein